MTKTACEKDDFKDKENPKYQCKRCGAKVNKKEKVCKPRKMDESPHQGLKNPGKNQISE